MVNNHIHIFTTDDIPNNFLPLGLVRWLAKKDRKVFNWILHNLNPFTDNDVLDRYLDFIRVGKLGGQKEIFENIMKEYPKETEFNVLTMDMSFMGAGKVPRNYELQLKELSALKKQYNQINSFVSILRENEKKSKEKKKNQGRLELEVCQKGRKNPFSQYKNHLYFLQKL